jgi:hypothetical protein
MTPFVALPQLEDSPMTELVNAILLGGPDDGERIMVVRDLPRVETVYRNVVVDKKPLVSNVYRHYFDLSPDETVYVHDSLGENEVKMMLFQRYYG